MSTDLKNYLQQNGIEFQHTMPYTPKQNGTAERKNRYIVEAIRTMLIDRRLPNKYWGEAVATGVYLQNRTLSGHKLVTPHELFFRKKPDVQHLKEFGCRALVHIQKKLRNKLNTKAKDCIFIGYPQNQKGYRLLEKPSGKVIISRDVKFIEDSRIEEKDGVETEFCLEHRTSTPEKLEEIVYIPTDIPNEHLFHKVPRQLE